MGMNLQMGCVVIVICLGIQCMVVKILLREFHNLYLSGPMIGFKYLF